MVLETFVLLATLGRGRVAAPVRARPGEPGEPLRGTIALVLDDWGYDKDSVLQLRSWAGAVTLAVLPDQPYAAQVATQAHRFGCEVIVHLPCEPHEAHALEPNTVKVSMKQRQVERILREALQRVPFAVGISNHMGSRVTENRKTMGWIFAFLKERRLFFLDSFVTHASVCERIAQEQGVVFARRDIFLDNNEDPCAIRAQLEKLKRKAEAKGFAVGIGHNRPATLAVLEREVPRLRREGFRFVRLSEGLKIVP